ncbi:MAG: DUF6155 family protein [Bacteroidota bacterium]
MKRDFLKLLKTLEEDELREELQMLYDRFPAVKEYYRLELSANTAAVLDKYKKQIRKAFFTGRGRRMGKRGRSNSKKTLKEFAQVSIHARDLVELHFYRVRVMLEAADFYYVTNEGFHQSIVSSYAEACRLAEKEVLLDSFREPARKLIPLAYFESVEWALREVFGRHWPDNN